MRHVLVVLPHACMVFTVLASFLYERLTLTLTPPLSGVPDQMVDAVSLLRERADNEEANVLYSLVNDLSKVRIMYM